MAKLLSRARISFAVVAALIAASLGIAAASASATKSSSITKGVGYDLARTYHLTVYPDAGTTTLTWPSVGKIALTTEVGAGFDSGSGVWAAGGKGLIITNNGSSPVTVALQLGSGAGNVTTEQHFEVLPAAGGTDQNSDAFFFVGELVNETTPTFGGVDSLAILSNDGTSATGTFAWSATFEPDHSAQFTLSLQLRG